MATTSPSLLPASVGLLVSPFTSLFPAPSHFLPCAYVCSGFFCFWFSLFTAASVLVPPPFRHHHHLRLVTRPTSPLTSFPRCRLLQGLLTRVRDAKVMTSLCAAATRLSGVGRLCARVCGEFSSMDSVRRRNTHPCNLGAAGLITSPLILLSVRHTGIRSCLYRLDGTGSETTTTQKKIATKRHETDDTPLDLNLLCVCIYL